MSHNDTLITHDATAVYDLNSAIARIKTIKNPILPQAAEIQLLKDLHNFALGKFLLTNQGLDGYWIAYCILYGLKQTNLSALEQWFLNAAPVILATRERFQIFIKLTEKYLQANATLASIPCGTMDDLYSVNYGTNDIKLVGIDLDQNSLDMAKSSPANLPKFNSKFLKKNAWALNIQNKFQMILSNGLNMYEPNDHQVTLLYREFYKALKPKGILITSFLTPAQYWTNYNSEDLLKQQAIFTDLIQPKFQSYRTPDQSIQQLEEAGLRVVEIINDKQAMYPTIVAQKP